MAEPSGSDRLSLCAHPGGAVPLGVQQPATFQPTGSLSCSWPKACDAVALQNKITFTTIQKFGSAQRCHCAAEACF